MTTNPCTDKLHCLRVTMIELIQCDYYITLEYYMKDLTDN